MAPESTYSLPGSHKDMLEKPLVETDSEVAEIMVSRLHKGKGMPLLTTGRHVRSSAKGNPSS